MPHFLQPEAVGPTLELEVDAASSFLRAWPTSTTSGYQLKLEEIPLIYFLSVWDTLRSLHSVSSVGQSVWSWLEFALGRAGHGLQVAVAPIGGDIYDRPYRGL